MEEGWSHVRFFFDHVLLIVLNAGDLAGFELVVGDEVV
jgi:hypothetical protein